MTDLTLAGLIAAYKTDTDSGYRKLRFKTRQSYDGLLRRLERDHGAVALADLKARTSRRWHDGWTAGGKIAMGHSLIGMLRTLASFGATILEDAECERISVVLHKMRFAMPKPRDEQITAEQVTAVRARAHARGLHSIALAQAFQFELMLRQKDVIGEWVPVREPGVSAVAYHGLKWLRGLRWEEIDADLILRHTTSKRLKDIEVDLKLAPMVMEELALLPDRPTAGAAIVSEDTGRPYAAHAFRRCWRTIATEAGVSANVFNMDSRAGAISEATDAGAEIEHVRHAATHSDVTQTQRYSRGATEKIAMVQAARARHRGSAERPA